MKRRNLILLLGGAGSGAMSVGTGAFSRTEADRGVEVSVAPDDEAFVGYENPSDGGSAVGVADGDSIELVAVKNRFPGETRVSIADVNVDVKPEEGDTPRIESVEYPESEFGAGESESVTGTVVCDDGGGGAEVEVTVRLAGSGVSAELFGDAETRRFEIECDPVPTVTGVDFRGKRNAELLVADDGQSSESADGGTVEARVYYVDGGKIRATDSAPVDVKDRLKGQTPVDGETVAGVRLAGAEGVYVHPQFDRSECDVRPDPGDDGSGVSGGKVKTTNDPTDAFGDCLADTG